MLGGVHVQLKQRSVPGLQSSVAIVDHLLGKLRLLRKCASKPSTSTIFARDGRKLTGDYDKLQCWVEHFSDVVNYESEVSMAALDALLVFKPPSVLSADVCVNEEHFSDVVNYELEVSMADLDALLVFKPPSVLSADVCVNELSDNLLRRKSLKRSLRCGREGLQAWMEYQLRC